MGYDQINYNTIQQLGEKVIAATNAYNVAQATSNALGGRLAGYQLQLSTAQAAAATALTNQSTAKNAQQSITGTLDAALACVQQGYKIYMHARGVFQQAHLAAEETMLAAYAVTDMAAKIASAEAKNSFITRQLLSGAQKSDTDGAAAVTATTQALESASLAVVESEKALMFSCLTYISLIDLEKVMNGFQPSTDPNSYGEIPDALSEILLSPPVVDDQAGDLQAASGEIISKLQGLLKQDTQGPEITEGLVALVNEVADSALKKETLIQDTTTTAVIDLSLANQELAQSAGALSTAQQALAAATAAIS